MSDRGRLVACLLAAMTATVCAAPARADDDAICTDRPGKGYSPCTAPAGHVQVETDLYDQSWSSSGGQNTVTTLYTDPTLKYGLDQHLDLEASIIPYETQRTRDRRTGMVMDQRGPGDLTLEAKYALTKDVALMPFVSVPTATDGLGLGGFAGGVRAPLQADLGHGWQLGATPELDVSPNQDRPGAHVATVQSVSLSRQLDRGVTLGAELWAQADFDPAGETTQASVDLLAAWIPTWRKDLQFDAEVYVGLTHATPDVQAIFGVAHRF